MKSKTKSRKFRLLTGILYVVILCLLATGTLAWFIFDKSATIENEGDMQIVAGSRLDISIDDGATWGSNFDVEIEQASYPDITGNGKAFICPMFLDSEDEVFADDPNTFRTVDEKNQDSFYITLKIKFRTAANTEVYLSNESYVKPKSLEVSDTNKSIYGNISRDAIAGAVRVGFSEVVSDANGIPMEEVRNIWIPNDKYELSYDGDVANFTDSGEREQSYGYLFKNNVGDIESYTFGGEDYYSRLVTVGDPSVLASPTQDEGSTAMINQAQRLLDFSSEANKETTGVREKTLIVRIWVEGTDREADKALVGGEMDYKLHFICIDKDENPNGERLEQIELNTETKTLSDIGGESLNGAVEYSTNGIDWTLYTGKVEYSEENEYIYLRFIETVANKASSVKAIPLRTEVSTE